MSRIHIARNQRSIGQFSPEEVAERLATGDFLPTDLGWREPMESWQPLSAFTDLPQVDLSLIPPALPDEAAAAKSTEPAAAEPAWERRQALGIVPAVIQTIRQIFSDPTAIFRTMKLEGGLGVPLGFFVLVAGVATLVAMTYSLILFIFYPEVVAESFGGKQVPASTLITGQIMAMVMSPFFCAVSAFAGAGVIHAVFMALSGSVKPFEATFRVWCYAVGSASVFQLFPICGSLAAAVTALAFLVIGLREVHKTDMSIAVAGVLLPSLLCCGCWFGLNIFAQSLAAQGLLFK